MSEQRIAEIRERNAGRWPEHEDERADLTRGELNEVFEALDAALSASPAETGLSAGQRDGELVRLRRIAAEKEPSQQEYLLALMRAREAELRVQELEGNVKELESERKSSENWLRAQRDVAEAKLAAETGRASETSGWRTFWGVIGPRGMPCLFGPHRDDVDVIDDDERIALFQVKEIAAPPPSASSSTAEQT